MAGAPRRAIESETPTERGGDDGRAESRRPCRTLERRALEAGALRLARLRGRGRCSSDSVAGHVQMKDSEFASGEAATALADARAGRPHPAGDRERAHPEPPVRRIEPRVRLDASPTVVQTLALQPNVTEHPEPDVQAAGGGQISRDGHSALVQFTSAATRTRRRTRSQPILDAVAGVQKRRTQTSPCARSATRARTTRSARPSTRTSRTPSG